MKTLNITTADGGKFELDWEVAKQSQTIRTMLDDLGIEDDDDCENTVPFFNEEVTGPVFKKLWFG